ncbi:hypothetical protein QTO30_14720 [Yoonia sp. GPGPB17]|uniref:hypothetical protein n=1 Tax=Yoonia sp. GPGPB17 TaxID=3026147 RepID=UPI0030BAE503
MLDTVALVPDDFTYHADAFILPGFVGVGSLASSWVALSQDDALRQQAINLVAQASSGDITGFRAAFEDFVLAWGDADDVAAGSRGPYIDARYLTFLENVFDESFAGGSGGNPQTRAGAQMTEGMTNLLDTMAAEFLAKVALSNAALNSSDDATFDALLLSNPLTDIFDVNIATSFSEIVADYDAGTFSIDDVKALLWLLENASGDEAQFRADFIDGVANAGSSTAGFLYAARQSGAEQTVDGTSASRNFVSNSGLAHRCGRR